MPRRKPELSDAVTRTQYRNLPPRATGFPPPRSGAVRAPTPGTLSSSDLDFDYTNFWVLVPRILNPGDIYSSSPIFSVIAAPEAQPGDYSGSFTILGGVDENAFDELATQNFQVTVTGTSSVPEPSTILLLGTSIAGLLVWRCRGCVPR